jgi:hypothetical protein
MANFEIDSAGVGRMLIGPEMHVLVDRVAHDAVAFAQSISPDAPPYGVGYISSFDVSLRTDNVTVRPGRRVVARIANTSGHAGAVELGWDTAHNQWANHAGYHVLARTKDWIEGR